MQTVAKSRELEKSVENSAADYRSPVILIKPSSRRTSARKASSWGWWGGIGAIVLCGICCSLPLLGGSLAFGGTVLLAFLNVSWLWLGSGVALVLLGSLLYTRQRKSKPAQADNGSTEISGKTCSCRSNGDSCSADRSCACGK